METLIDIPAVCGMSVKPCSLAREGRELGGVRGDWRQGVRFWRKRLDGKMCTICAIIVQLLRRKVRRAYISAGS